jgi:hypothetical protein
MLGRDTREAVTKTVAAARWDPRGVLETMNEFEGKKKKYGSRGGSVLPCRG